MPLNSHSFNVDNEETEIVKMLYNLGQPSIQMETAAKKIRRRVKLGRAVMKELEKNLKQKNTLLEIRARCSMVWYS